jgi:hypothetical protein
MGSFNKFILMALVFIFTGLLLGIQVQAEDEIAESDTSLEVIDSTDNLGTLAELLHNGKPTLAYFYQSVSCSCTVAHCQIAKDALAGIEELKPANKDLNFISIDFFYAEAAESLYKCQVVPLIIGFDKAGKEVGRAEWDIDDKVINDILAKMKE